MSLVIIGGKWNPNQLRCTHSSTLNPPPLFREFRGLLSLSCLTYRALWFKFLPAASPVKANERGLALVPVPGRSAKKILKPMIGSVVNAVSQISIGGTTVKGVKSRGQRGASYPVQRTGSAQNAATLTMPGVRNVTSVNVRKVANEFLISIEKAINSLPEGLFHI